MSKKIHLRSKIRARRRRDETKSLILKTASDASRNAKRSSIALDLDYNIIKNGDLYEVTPERIIKLASLPKVEVEKSGLTKGSRICLK